MDASDLVFWLCALTNITLSLTLAIHLRKLVKSHIFTEMKAKRVYSWLTVMAGIFSGLVLFLAIVELFHIQLSGHGEILIASPLFNLLLSGILVFIGRMIIGWEPVKW